MQATDWIAAYAALVGTVGLALQGVLWWRAGARLSISLMPEAIFLDGAPLGVETKVWVLVTVANRGDRPTTLTHLAVYEFRSRAHFIRRRKERRAWYVPHPEVTGGLGQLPHKLEPGATWTGAIGRRDEVQAAIEAGWAYVGISASHKNGPTYAFVKPPKPE